MMSMVSGIVVFVLLLQVEASPTEMEARLVDGRTVVGALVDWNDNQITLAAADGQPNSIDVDQFASLVPRHGDAAPRVSADDEEPICDIRVGLQAGTLLCGASITGNSQNWTLIRGDQTTVTLPASELKYVRFGKPTAELRQQWSDLLEGDFTGDVLVIRRSPSSLDFLEGVVHGITEQQVLFEFENERIEVKREKLEGCLFFSRRQPQRPAAQMKIHTMAGELIQARQVRLRHTAWALRTVEGIALTLPADQVQDVEFASSRVAFLGDMQPVASETSIWLGSLEGKNEPLKLVYAPRFNRGYDGPLQLKFNENDGRRTFSKGLALHSRTRLVFRLDGSQARLMGWAGLAPELEGGGSARLIITLDTRVVFDQLLERGSDPIALDLDIHGGRRLEIQADYGDDGDVGDRLYLCDLRMIR